MKWLTKLVEVIKIFCSCKSTCIIGEDLRVTADTTEDNFKIKISYV